MIPFIISILILLILTEALGFVGILTFLVALFFMSMGM